MNDKNITKETNHENIFVSFRSYYFFILVQFSRAGI